MGVVARRDGWIDALRGVAILLVLVFHLRPDALPWGYVGVDVFIVVSGYFIGIQAIRGTRAPADYAFRRMARIIPELSVFLVAVLLASALTLPPGALGATALSTLLSGMFLYDVIPIEAGYFTQNTYMRATPHLWSIALEVKAYLLFAAFLFAPPRARVPALAAVAAVSLGADLLENYSYQHPLPRLWQFCAGALIGARVRGAGALAGGICLAGAAIALSGGALSAASATASVAAVIALALPWRTGADWIAPLAALGRISYGVYLWHWAVIRFTFLAFGREPGLAVELAIVGASLGLGVLSRQIVELRLGRSIAKNRRYAVLFLLWIVPILLAFSLGSGAPGRIDAPDAKAVIAELDRASYRDCNTDTALASGAARCVYGTEPAIALMGDSHGVALGRGLAAKGVAFHDFSVNACPLSTLRSPANHPGCAALHRAARDRIIADPGIEDVILYGRWMKYLAPDFSNDGYTDLQGVRDGLSRSDGFAGAEHLDAFADQLSDLVEAFRNAGKTVTIVGQTPIYAWEPPQRVIMADLPIDLTAHLGPMTVSRAALEARYAPMRARLADMPAHFVDPMPLFCGPEVCRPMPGGEMMVLDRDHLSVAGASRLAGHLISVGSIRQAPQRSTSRTSRHPPGSGPAMSGERDDPAAPR